MATIRRPIARCGYCGKRLQYKGSGRPRRYCDPKHKAKAYRAHIRRLLAQVLP